MVNLKIAPKGLAGVLVSETNLSNVDGAKGKLIYCGYNIKELLNCSYEEICCLFLYGKLPNKNELLTIENILKKERNVPDFILNFIANNAKTNHPMAVLRSSISMLSSENYNLENISETNLKHIGLSLISKTATISAAICRVRSNLKILQPNFEFGHAENFLQMSTGRKNDDIIVQTLNTSLVLHADHSFNASTFASRVVASTLSDIISSVTAAIGSLKGPLHGGANTAVMKMLLEIGEVENVKSWLEKSLARKDKIMGFGHRIYKVLDPRAKPLKQMSKEWGKRIGNVKWFNISEKLEVLMKEKKRINANVDFYSASTYYSMGIKPEMFTVIFAMARVLGWVAHYIEQMKDNRIMRPSSLYIGLSDKKFLPIEDRK